MCVYAGWPWKTRARHKRRRCESPNLLRGWVCVCVVEASSPLSFHVLFQGEQGPPGPQGPEEIIEFPPDFLPPKGYKVCVCLCVNPYDCFCPSNWPFYFIWMNFTSTVSILPLFGCISGRQRTSWTMWTKGPASELESSGTARKVWLCNYDLNYFFLKRVVEETPSVKEWKERKEFQVFLDFGQVIYNIYSRKLASC